MNAHGTLSFPFHFFFKFKLNHKSRGLALEGMGVELL